LTIVSDCRFSIICLFPIFFSDLSRNPVTQNQVFLLQSNNVASNSTGDCDFLYFAVQSWLKSSASVRRSIGVVARRSPLLQWAQLFPIRCDWQRQDGVITTCGTERPLNSACDHWDGSITDDPNDATAEHFANYVGARPDGIVEITSQTIAPADFVSGQSDAVFIVRALFNESHTIELTYVYVKGFIRNMVCNSHPTSFRFCFRTEMQIYLCYWH
jgi:hypothetical protein